MNAPHLVGVKPDKDEPQPSYPVVHCRHCGKACVVAFDGRFDEDELTELHARAFDFEPTPIESRYMGDAVLWFFVDGSKAIGLQRFTRIGDMDPSYAGDRWQYHRNSCGGRQLELGGVR
jgi:hypothetical protein